MSSLKICVYAICKNEEQFVDRWMDAVKEADMVVVVDTGSTDGTVEKLRTRGAVVYPETIRPWRFDTARNAAMDHIPGDFDLCVSNDLDEVFEPGWREKLERDWKQSHTRAQYWFAWSHSADGGVHKRYPMEKIHRRHGFRWVRPVHEILEYSGNDPDDAVFIDDLVLHHFPDLNKPRSQYLPLLELSVEEFPQDDRLMFWLGREYYYYRQYDRAIDTLKRHLALPTATWSEERSASMQFLAQCHLQTGNVPEAKSWLFQAAAESPSTREPWLALAQLGYGQGDWPLTFFAVENGLAVESKTDSYLTDPACWGYLPYDLGAIACYRLEMYRKALRYSQLALEHNPGDPRLEQNLAIIAEKCR